MIFKTDFQKSGAGDLVDYIRRDRSQDADRTVAVRNAAGRELADAEVTRFVEKSREFGFQRHMILSPEPTADYTPEEVSTHSRAFMNQEFAEEPTTDYVYAVHRDTEFPHAHVAATGQQAELEMHSPDLDRFRNRAATEFNEAERVRQADITSRERITQDRQQSDPTDREVYHENELELDENPQRALQKESAPEKTQSSERAKAREIDLQEERERVQEQVEEQTKQLEAEAESEAHQEAEESEAEREIEWSMGDSGEF
jgi:hypothetical protein